MSVGAWPGTRLPSAPLWCIRPCRRLGEKLIELSMLGSLVPVAILLTVLARGLPALSWAMLTQTPRGGYYLGKEGGILNAIAGSLCLAGGATLLALACSLPLALYLHAYARGSRWADLVRLALDALWGVPSIVYGAFAFTLMLLLGLRASLLGGILVLALLELPIMARAMDEVIRNVAYGRRIHGLRNGRSLDQTVQHYLELAGLWSEVKDRLHTPATRLSAGQQQRLCLARGLAVEPEILLLDEPTSALDPISSQHIEKRLLDLKREYTIVLVTHILRQARRLADHVLFMYLGELVECEPASEVLAQPREERTRAYLAGEF